MRTSEPTNWWRSACRDCGALLAPFSPGAHPSTGGATPQLCAICAEVHHDGPGVWDLLALIGDPAAATDLTGG